MALQFSVEKHLWCWKPSGAFRDVSMDSEQLDPSKSERVPACHFQSPCPGRETYPCAWAVFQRTPSLSLFRKQIRLGPWRGACLENLPKSLECCFPVFLLSKWLQLEFCRSEMHFLSVVLSSLTSSRSHAFQVLAWVSWEPQEVKRKWEAPCSLITPSVFHFVHNGSERSTMMDWQAA